MYVCIRFCVCIYILYSTSVELRVKVLTIRIGLVVILFDFFEVQGRNRHMVQNELDECLMMQILFNAVAFQQINGRDIYLLLSKFICMLSSDGCANIIVP